MMKRIWLMTLCNFAGNGLYKSIPFKTVTQCGNHSEELIKVITQTCPCNILQYFTAIKMTIFRLKIVKFFLLLLKTLIVGTR